MFVGPCLNCFVNDNTFVSGGGGLESAGALGGTVSNNKFENAGGLGVTNFGFDATPTVSNNTITSGDIGIELDGTSAVVTANAVRRHDNRAFPALRRQ